MTNGGDTVIIHNPGLLSGEHNNTLAACCSPRCICLRRCRCMFFSALR
jgi:hypothetical protein